jgi:hypothetical protein
MVSGNGFSLRNVEVLISMIDDVIFCRRPLSHLGGHLSSRAYHKLVPLRALNTANTTHSLTGLKAKKIDDENYIGFGVIENNCRGKITRINYGLSLKFIRNMVWIVDDFEIS